MRSIREKLFLSIGSIFLVIALLSYLVPHIFVRKDIDRAANYLNDYYGDYQKKQTNLSQGWIEGRFVLDAAELTAVSQSIQVDNKPIWDLAASALDQDPIIVVVQITDKEGKSAVILAEDAIAYTPEWALDERGGLVVKIREQSFSTQSLPHAPSSYLLYKREPSTLSFQSFEKAEAGKFSQNRFRNSFDVLLAKQSVELEKNRLIQELAPFHGKAAGIMKWDGGDDQAIAYLSDDIFSETPFYRFTEPPEDLVIVEREKGAFVDVVSFATREAPYVLVGSSLSTIAAQIAKTAQKPVLLYKHDKLMQAFDGQGKRVNRNEFQFQNDKIVFENVAYFANTIPIGQLNFTLLISEAEKNLIPNLFTGVRQKLVTELSYNMLMLALLLLLFALFLLARISKTLTKPITQLALASEEIGTGKYEGLKLPDVANRSDEVAILTSSFEKMAASLMDREKIRGVLNKVVSKEIAGAILSGSIELGGEERELTMLFSDIRGFTPLSETMDAAQLIALLNSYMTRMCRVIDATHGVVDKFVGDEIMALYGAPLPFEDHADKALESAWLMLQDLREWNAERKGKKEITVGIGLHTGSAFAGNMGAENRLNYTVVGANVNLAARLCSAALPMQILLSKACAQALKEPSRFTLQKLTPISLKGIEEPVEVYELTSMNEIKIISTQSY